MGRCRGMGFWLLGSRGGFGLMFCEATDIAV